MFKLTIMPKTVATTTSGKTVSKQILIVDSFRTVHFRADKFVKFSASSELVSTQYTGSHSEIHILRN